MTCNALSIVRSVVHFVWLLMLGLFNAIRPAIRVWRGIWCQVSCGKAQPVQAPERAGESHTPANSTGRPGTALQEVDAESDGCYDRLRSEAFAKDVEDEATSGVDAPVVEANSDPLEALTDEVSESSGAASDEPEL
jgi:hypothetical protein